MLQGLLVAWLLVWEGCMVAFWEGGIDWVLGVGALEAAQASLCFNANAPLKGKMCAQAAVHCCVWVSTQTFQGNTWQAAVLVGCWSQARQKSFVDLRVWAGIMLLV